MVLRSGSARAAPEAARPPLGRARFACLLACVMLALGGCLPIPNLQLDLNVAPPAYRVAPAEVNVDYVTRPAFDEAQTPDELDRTSYLRYWVDERPHTVMILVPGIFGGAATFDVLARQLVASTPGLEVWAWDRRSNLLEDRGAAIRSLQVGDPQIAYRYYVAERGGERGFNALPFEEVGFMRRWGLDVHLRDLHQVVLDARLRAPRLILGGHSLGAAMASLYAAYRIPGAAEQLYGHEYLDGLVLLDGALGRTGGFDRDDVGVGWGPLRLAPSVEALEEGRGPPYLDSIINPYYQAERDAIALLARLAPDQQAPAELAPFPITNLALAGVRNDDEYALVPLFGASMGEAVGAEFDGNLTAVLLGGLQGVRSRRVAGVAPGAELVEWGPGDAERERTDIESYVAAASLRETNLAEWYFPLRLALDMTLLDPALEDTPGFLPNRLVSVPTLALGAGRGLIPGLEGFRTYANVRYGSAITAHVLPGLTHLDIVTARSNPAVPILQSWMNFLGPPD